jgi:hypothetical protein
MMKTLGANSNNGTVNPKRAQEIIAPVNRGFLYAQHRA